MLIAKDSTDNPLKRAAYLFICAECTSDLKKGSVVGAIPQYVLMGGTGDAADKNQKNAAASPAITLNPSTSFAGMTTPLIVVVANDIARCAIFGFSRHIAALRRAHLRPAPEGPNLKGHARIVSMRSVMGIIRAPAKYWSTIIAVLAFPAFAVRAQDFQSAPHSSSTISQSARYEIVGFSDSCGMDIPSRPNLWPSRAAGSHLCGNSAWDDTPVVGLPNASSMAEITIRYFRHRSPLNGPS